MLNSLPITLLAGTALGFLAGIGVGGGSLLMLWLTLILGLEHAVARNINLLFFIPSAIIASFFRWKQGTLELKKIIPAVLAGCLAAGAASFLSAQINLDNLKKLFGILLLITGIRELFYRRKNAK